MGHAKITVDIDALDQLAGKLDRIKAVLEGTKAGQLADPSVLGDDALANEVHHFVDNWSQGRKRIITEIEQLATVVRGAAQGYRQTDDALRDNMTTTAQGKGGSGSGTPTAP